jgi:hypothetical protein
LQLAAVLCRSPLKAFFMTLGNLYLQSAIKRLLGYKELAEKTFAQLEEKDFYFQPNQESNSIAIIVQHISGNMFSRFTNFLTEDGEKSWRNRDKEFDTDPQFLTSAHLLAYWEKGWACVLSTLRSLQEEDLLKDIIIRGESLSAVDAINRQLAHYPHHIGQILYIGKMIKNDSWKTLSIARGQSDQFNRGMQGKG